MKFLKIRGLKKDDGTPRFVEFNLDNKDEIISESSDLGGRLVSVTQSSYEYEGQTKYGFKIVMEYEDQKFQLECGFNQIGEAIINTLASMNEASKYVTIGLYVNKKGFNSVSVKYDGKPVDWKLSPSEKNEYIQTTEFGGQTLRDRSDLHRKLYDEFIPQIQAVIDGELSALDAQEDESFD